ncbi:CDP-glycerol glycerophosphotransferase family protein [Halorussus sp. MSC15.2]|uniref:CDP-glycerol glycerophosphotransferase family protein n=1 Tax=Halorussus sp. MSC15.2 TaxID=2283638 RepID=UPI0013D1774D|nr:CDP-glycerol glycerophosphotransferase family protein [Halorussus sp. MSC15.2]NEU56301.1 glycosyl/glycerophosphate transferase [Halorussus sp. MSC15.2]
MDLNASVSRALASLSDSTGTLTSLADDVSFLAQWRLFRGVKALDSRWDRTPGLARDESLWAFGARGGTAFADNAKYLYLHVAARHPEIRAVWLSKDPEVVRELQAEGFEAYHCYSPRGLLLTLRAGAVFLTQGHRDLAMPFVAGALTVLLWHGLPLKRISWDAEFRHRPAPVRRTQARLSGEFDLLTIPGEGAADVFASGLRIDRERMVATGYPRNDALFAEIPGERVGTDAAALDRVRDLAEGRDAESADSPSLVCYLPTFREWTDESVADRLDFTALDAFLAERDATLVVKTHPRDSLDLPEGLSRVVQLPEATDVYPLLRYADALVTDYSSLYFDYLLLDRPVVFYPYDLDEYRARRGFYFDYESVTPGTVARTFDGLLAGLDRALDPADDRDAPRREAVRTRLLGATPPRRRPATRPVAEPPRPTRESAGTTGVPDAPPTARPRPPGRRWSPTSSGVASPGIGAKHGGGGRIRSFECAQSTRFRYGAIFIFREKV